MNAEQLLSLFTNSNYSCALMLWSHGVGILLASNDQFSRQENLMRKMWKIAIELGSLGSLEVLLQYETEVQEEDWDKLNRTWYDRWGHTRVDKKDQQRRRSVFRALATRLAHCYNNRTNATQSAAAAGYEYDELSKRPYLYHIYYLSRAAAESAWATGYHDLHSARYDITYSEYGTPLWLAASNTLRIYSEDGVRYRGGHGEIITWLLDHGADPTWTHPDFGTTPAHLLARRACNCTVRTNDQHDSKAIYDLKEILAMQQPDSCICYCSSGGCTTIGYAVPKYFNYFHRCCGVCHDRRNVRSYVLEYVDRHRDATWMASAVLRVITFEALKLTHTCCHGILDEVREGFSRPTPEEAEVIHDLERTEIELLDTLVTEFETKWSTYTKSFPTFIRRVWQSRMRYIRRKRQIDHEVYQAELRRMGVTLHEPGEKVYRHWHSDSESDWLGEDEESDTESEGDGWYTTDEEETEDKEDKTEEPAQARIDDVGLDMNEEQDVHNA